MAQGAIGYSLGGPPLAVAPLSWGWNPLFTGSLFLGGGNPLLTGPLPIYIGVRGSHSILFVGRRPPLLLTTPQRLGEALNHHIPPSFPHDGGFGHIYYSFYLARS